MYNKTKSIAVTKDILRRLTLLKLNTEVKSLNDVIILLLDTPTTVNIQN